MYVYFSQNRKNSQNEKSMRVPVPVYLILSQNVLHESLQKLILRFVAGLLQFPSGADAISLLLREYL